MKSKQPTSRIKMLCAHILFFLLSCADSANSVFAQFQISYGTSASEIGRSLDLDRNSNGGYIVAGQTSHVTLGAGDATLVKTDANGTPIWESVYGGAKYDDFFSVRSVNSALAPGGYVAAGITSSFGFGKNDMYFIGIDLNGIPTFASTYGGAENDMAYCVQPIIDPVDGPGYILVGETSSFPAIAGVNVYVVRTDLFGNLKDAAVIGTSYSDRGYWIEQTSDNGYIIAGSTTYKCSEIDTTINQNLYIVKLDSKLNLQWNKIFGGPKPYDDIAYCVKEDNQSTAANGGYIITGITRSLGTAGDAFLLKLSAVGNVLWMKTYGASKTDQGNSLLVSKDASGMPGYVVAGVSNSFTTGGNNDAYVFKTDISGNLIASATFGGLSQEYTSQIIPNAVPGPGYTMTGKVTSFGAGSNDIYLIELNNALSTDGPCEKRPQQNVRNVSPCFSSKGKLVHVSPFFQAPRNFKRIEYAINKCNAIAAAQAKIAGEDEDLRSSGQHQVTLGPIPATNILSVKTDVPGTTSRVKILDNLGRTLVEEEMTTDVKDINIEGLSQGIYFLQIISSGEVMARSRFIKE